MPISIVFGLTRSRLEPTIYHTRGGTLINRPPMLSFAFKKLKNIQNHIQCPITFEHYLNNKSDM